MLPPLPTPNLDAQWTESVRGCAVVLSLVTLLVGATTGVIVAAERSLPYTWGFCGLIVGLACVALVCLVYLMLGDPGVVQRTEATCLPVPGEVKAKLAAGSPLVGALNSNIQEEGVPRPRSYCVRCFVWRPHAPPGMPQPHHCSICQRCVVSFDHHCSVFGRCIAGTRTSGNMPFFVTIIACGQLGIWTTVVGVSIALVTRWGWWAFGIAVGCGFAACLLTGPSVVACTMLFSGRARQRLRQNRHVALRGSGLSTESVEATLTARADALSAAAPAYATSEHALDPIPVSKDSGAGGGQGDRP